MLAHRMMAAAAGVSRLTPLPANTKFLCHADGTDGSTTFTDTSSSGYTITANGNAQVDTAQFKFGTGSALFDGTGDYLNVDTNSAILGSGDFTVACWIRVGSSVSNRTIMTTRDGVSGSNKWLFFMGSTISLSWSTGDAAIISNVGNLSTNTWHHVAAIRSSGTLKIYLDGTGVGSAADSNNYNAATDLRVGIADGSNSAFIGHMDEILIANSAVWTSDFTPPTRPYEDAP